MKLVGVDRNGREFDVSSIRDWRVLYFWSPACPCVERSQRLSIFPLIRLYSGKVRFFAISSNASSLSIRPGGGVYLRVVGEKERLPICPLLLDPGHRIADALRAETTPQCFLLDPAGKVVFSGPPDDSGDVLARESREGMRHRYLADALSAALAGKPIRLPKSPTLGCTIDRSDVKSK